MLTLLTGTPLAGLATSGGAFVVARFVQRTASASISPSTPPAITGNFRGKARTPAFLINIPSPSLP